MSSIPVRTNADDLELLSGSSVTSNELQDRDDDFEEDDDEQQVEETESDSSCGTTCGHLNCYGMDRCIEAFELEKQCKFCNVKKSLCECGDLGPVTSPSSTITLSSTNSFTTVEVSSTNSSVVIIQDITQIDGANSNSSDSLNSENGGRSTYNDQQRLPQSRFTRYCRFHVPNCRCFAFHYKYPHLRRNQYQ